MGILDVGVIVLLLFAVAIGIAFALTAGLSLPLADLINRMLKRVGLAGAHSGSRTIGAQGVGHVENEFRVSASGEVAEGKLLVKGELWNARCELSLASTLHRGDEVDFTYDDDLVVNILRKRSSGRGR